MEDADEVEEEEASDSVLLSPWTAPRQSVEAEEDTLQSGNRRGAATVATDDDTLDDGEIQLNLRGRRVLVTPWVLYACGSNMFLIPIWINSISF